MKAYEKRLKRRAAKVAGLREDGAHSKVARLSDNWTKRKSNNTTGFWDKKAAKAK